MTNVGCKELYECFMQKKIYMRRNWITSNDSANDNVGHCHRIWQQS